MKILGNIFSKQKHDYFDAYSFLKTDIHSHLIPNVDDGTKDFNETVEIIKELKQLGYKKLIITPHINSEYKNNKEDLISKYNHLNQIVSSLQLDIEIAAEYLIEYGFEDKINQTELLSFNSKKYILIELPFLYIPQNFFNVIFELRLNGYFPILAHPERYPQFYQDFQKYVELKDREILFQVNIVSFTGLYDNYVKKIAIKLLDNNLIDFLGSDTHNHKYITCLQTFVNDPLFSKIQKKTFLNSTL